MFAKPGTFLTCSMCWFLLAVWEAGITLSPAGSLTDQLRDHATKLGISSAGVLQGATRKSHLEQVAPGQSQADVLRFLSQLGKDRGEVGLPLMWRPAALTVSFLPGFQQWEPELMSVPCLGSGAKHRKVKSWKGDSGVLALAGNCGCVLRCCVEHWPGVRSWGTWEFGGACGR